MIGAAVAEFQPQGWGWERVRPLYGLRKGPMPPTRLCVRNNGTAKRIKPRRGLQQDAGQDDAAGGGRLGVGVWQPVWTGMEGSLVAKAAKKPSIGYRRTDPGEPLGGPRHHASTPPANAGHASGR